jgi:hypothetical protein
MLWLLASVLFSIGSINALIPIILILLLIVAAAGLNRGFSLFNIFGISTLAGINPGGKSSIAGKTAFSVLIFSHLNKTLSTTKVATYAANRVKNVAKRSTERQTKYRTTAGILARGTNLDETTAAAAPVAGGLIRAPVALGMATAPVGKAKDGSKAPGAKGGSGGGMPEAQARSRTHARGMSTTDDKAAPSSSKGKSKAGTTEEKDSDSGKKGSIRATTDESGIYPAGFAGSERKPVKDSAKEAAAAAAAGIGTAYGVAMTPAYLAGKALYYPVNKAGQRRKSREKLRSKPPFKRIETKEYKAASGAVKRAKNAEKVFAQSLPLSKVPLPFTDKRMRDREARVPLRPAMAEIKAAKARRSGAKGAKSYKSAIMTAAFVASPVGFGVYRANTAYKKSKGHVSEIKTGDRFADARASAQKIADRVVAEHGGPPKNIRERKAMERQISKELRKKGGALDQVEGFQTGKMARNIITASIFAAAAGAAAAYAGSKGQTLEGRQTRGGENGNIAQRARNKASGAAAGFSERFKSGVKNYGSNKAVPTNELAQMRAERDAAKKNMDMRWKNAKSVGNKKEDEKARDATNKLYREARERYEEAERKYAKAKLQRSSSPSASVTREASGAVIANAALSKRYIFGVKNQETKDAEKNLRRAQEKIQRAREVEEKARKAHEDAPTAATAANLASKSSILGAAIAAGNEAQVAYVATRDKNIGDKGKVARNQEPFKSTVLGQITEDAVMKQKEKRMSKTTNSRLLEEQLEHSMQIIEHEKAKKKANEIRIQSERDYEKTKLDPNQDVDFITQKEKENKEIDARINSHMGLIKTISANGSLSQKGREELAKDPNKGLAPDEKKEDTYAAIREQMAKNPPKTQQTIMGGKEAKNQNAKEVQAFLEDSNPSVVIAALSNPLLVEDGNTARGADERIIDLAVIGDDDEQLAAASLLRNHLKKSTFTRDEIIAKARAKGYSDDQIDELLKRLGS